MTASASRAFSGTSTCGSSTRRPVLRPAARVSSKRRRRRSAVAAIARLGRPDLDEETGGVDRERGRGGAGRGRRGTGRPDDDPRGEVGPFRWSREGWGERRAERQSNEREHQFQLYADGEDVSGTGVTNRERRERETGDGRRETGDGREPASPSRRFGRGPRAVRYVPRPPAERARPASELAAAGRGARANSSLRSSNTRAGLIPARSSRTRAGPRACSRAARGTHRPTRGRRASATRREPPVGGRVPPVTESGLRSTLCVSYSRKSRPDPICRA